MKFDGIIFDFDCVIAPQLSGLVARYVAGDTGSVVVTAFTGSTGTTVQSGTLSLSFWDV